MKLIYKNKNFNNKKFTLSKLNESKGQGLIEVIVSLAIIVVAILGALSLATLTIKAGAQSRERVQAALLAQEGIEIVKNNRDTNWIKIDEGELIDWANLPLSQINFPTSTVGLLNGNVGGDFSKFDRGTTVSGSGDKKTVTCVVSWTDSGTTHNVTAIDYITNWQLK
jgi:Tfp pilus assembly protein PilV